MNTDAEASARTAVRSAESQVPADRVRTAAAPSAARRDDRGILVALALAAVSGFALFTMWQSRDHQRPAERAAAPVAAPAPVRAAQSSPPKQEAAPRVSEPPAPARPKVRPTNDDPDAPTAPAAAPVVAPKPSVKKRIALPMPEIEGAPRATEDGTATTGAAPAAASAGDAKPSGVPQPGLSPAPRR